MGDSTAMTAEPKICPCCGQRVFESATGSAGAPDRGAGKAAKVSAAKADEAARQTVDAPEYDRRGIRLPRRTRMGGIIVPQ